MARHTFESFSTAIPSSQPARTEEARRPATALADAASSDRLVTDPAQLGASVARAAALAGVLFGLATGALLALTLAGPAPERLQQDAELATLVRAMVGIKALILFGALALLLWRLAKPVTGRRLLGYTATLALSGAAVAWMWSLNSIPLAALGFYGGLIGCYRVASGDGNLLRIAHTKGSSQ
jgi:hypothetical protein